MKTNRSTNTNSKHKSTAHSQRLVLESRLVFDGAMVATVAEAQPDTVDNKPITENISAAATPPSEPPVDFTAEKTPPVVDFQANVDSTDNQPAFPVEHSPLDVKALPVAPVVGVSGEYASIVIVVDPRANNAADLMAHPPANTQIMMLDTTRDGFQQVAELLQGRHDVTELHLLPWTQDNAQWLGNKTLSATLEPSVSDALTQWGDSFADNANIVFHGINNPSTSWLSHIDALTGADTRWLQDTSVHAINPTTVHELVVVDTSIENYQSLLNDVNPNAEILYIDPSKDGIQQIADSLKGRTDISALHIMSHGSQGSFTLGTSTLNSDNIDSYQSQLADIGQSLTNNGDILFYGCNVADGAAGAAFINRLAALTQADISASDDATGNAAKGGNWTLEYNSGAIETASLVATGYDGLLAAPVNTVPAAQSVAEDNSLTFGAGKIISIADADGVVSTVTVSVAHGTLTLSGIAGLTLTGNGTGVISITGGTIAAINTALNGLIYNPTANYSGADTLTIATFDGTTTDTDTVAITVTPNATAPALTLPITSQLAQEDVPTYLDFTATNAIILTDADANDQQTLTLSVAHGTLLVKTNVVGGVTTATNNGTGTVTLTGTAAQLSATLADSQGIQYTSALNYNSSDPAFAATPEALSFSLSDGVVAHNKSGTVGINVTPVNDAPTFTGATPALAVECGSVAFSLAQLASSANALDVDIQTGQQVILQLAVKIDSLPVGGILTYKDGAVAIGSIIPVTDLANLKFTHDGTDIISNQTISFNVTVSDGGGGSTAGSMSVTVQPKNVAPSISGAPTLIEGQVKVVAPTINLGDAADTLANSTITIDNIITGGQGSFFLDANNNNVIDVGETISGTITLDATQRTNLSTQLKFSQNGNEPNIPATISPSYRITVTDAGGATGIPSAAIAKTITLNVQPNNDDPTLLNTHASVGTALTAQEGNVTAITAAMLKISDVDRDPANLAQTTPENQLVYTVETRPTQGEIQIFVGGGLGYGLDGWITLGDGGRFTQAQVTAGEVRYYQTTNVPDVVTTMDNFTFTVRDSAYGYDVWTDPANPTSNREGGLRATPTGVIATQQFYLGITPLPAANTPRTNVDPIGGEGNWEGAPRPATPGFGGSTMVYSFVPTSGMLSNNSTAAGTWDEANVNTGGAGNIITATMLSYTITRTDTMGTPLDPTDDVSIMVPPDETVYTLTVQPSNGIVQSFASGSWQTIPTNGQFTQADINSGNIRFVHDGGEDHISSFGYTVSDGTPNHYTSTFGLDITPTNDRPTALGGLVKVNEKLLPTNDGLVRLGSSALGMSDVDLSLDISKQATPEGKQDFLWFKIIAQPADAGATQHGELQRWNGSAWVTVTLGEWLPSTLLTTIVGGATSGLRYAHDGSEPLAYPTNPNVTFQYQVRDDLLNPNNPFATDTSAVADTSGSAQSNESALATTTIQIIPVNNAPVIADKPSDADPTIIGTIASGGALTGVNEILSNVPEGGTVTITSAFLTAIDQDNTTVQRQYILTSLPTQGNLLLNNQFLGAFSTFTQDDIDNNRLTYRHNGSEFPTPTTDALGTYSDKFHFIVSDAVFYDFGANAPNYNTFLIDFGAVPNNDAPTIVGPSGIIEIDSATPANNLVTGFVIADPDLANGVQAGETDFVQVTVRLLDSTGTPLTNYSTGFAGAGVNIGYTAQSGGLWAVTQTGVDSILQLQGSRAQVNAALAGLTVTFANDANSMYKVQVIVDDRMRDAAGALNATGNDANGGELNQATTVGGTPTAVPNTVYDWSTAVAVPAIPNGNIAAAIVDIRASSVNEVPLLAGSPTLSIALEDVRTLIPTGFIIADPESAAFNTPVTVTFSIPAGQGTLDVVGLGTQTSFTPSGGQAIIISGDGTTSITLTGRAADIQAMINQRNFADTANDTNGGLYYSAPANGNHDYNGGSVGDVILTFSLNDAGSRFGSDVGAGSVAANATTSIPIIITPVNDAPTVARINTTIPIIGTTAVTGFSITDVDNTDGSALNATTGEVDFIQATVRLLPAAGTVPLPATGGVGGVDHSNVVLSSSTVGGATVDTTYTGNGSALVIRGTMAQVNTYLSGLTVALNGGLANNNTTYRVQVVADDRLRDVVTGVLDGSNAANGGLNLDVTGTTVANVPVTVVDPYAAIPAGLTLNVANNTRAILSSGVNEAPSFALLDNTPTFVENSVAPIVLDANATLTDPELIVYSNWTQAVLTLARNGGASSDDVFGVTGSGTTGINFSGANIRNNATNIGTFTNNAGTLAITFNASATNAVVNLVLQAITYSNTNNTPPASVTINYTINDGDTDPDRATNGQGTGGALIGTGSINIGITPVNDAPTLSGLGPGGFYTEDSAAMVIGSGITLNDPELKTFASGAGDWGNAYLVLSRNGVADVNDVFSASGSLSTLTEGSTLLDGVTTIGTVTQNTAGILAITFADGVTTAQVTAALSKIAYSNTIQSLEAGAILPVTLNWVLHDGDTDPDRVLNGQGTGGDKSNTRSQTINLTGVNDAPVLSDTVLSLTQTEDAIAPVGAVGTLVSVLASGSNISDADTYIVANPTGIAITATDSTHGTWYYSTNNGTNWTAFTASNTTARLLAADANTRVYFQPTANWHGSITSGLTIRAWDASTGTNGLIAAQDLSIGVNVGGTTAFSSATDVVAVTVTPVNDQPIASTDVVLPAVIEDTLTPNGTLISGLAFNYSDTTDNQTGNGGGDTSTAFSYIAIVGSTGYNATQGSWQVSTTASPNPAVAGDWITIPVSGLSTSAALIFASDRQIRFVPAANFYGTPGTLQVRLADNNTDLTGTGKTSPNATTLFNLATVANGGTGTTDAWNAVNRNISTTVTPDNDAPVVDLNGAVTGFDNAVTWTEGANVAHTPIAITPNATVTDVDNTNMTQLVMQVGGVLDGNSEVLNIGGTVFQLGTTVSNVDIGSFLVSFDSVTKIFTIVPDGTSIALATSFQTLIQGITYINTTDNPTAGDRTVNFNITDAGYDNGALVGGELGSNTPVATITVVPANDQPVITGLNAVTYFENAINATAAIIDGSITLTDIDSPDYNTGTLTVSGLIAGQDTVSLPVGAATVLGNVQINGGNVEYYDGSSWVVIGTQSGGVGANFIVTFNANATAAIVQRVIENLTFANSSDNPTLTRTLTLAVNDGDGGTVQNATVGVTIKLDNDAPIMSATVLGGTYTEQNATPLQFVSGVINVSDPDSPANFYINVAAVAGSLTVALDTYVAGDTLSVLHQGTGAGQIGVSGATISYGNVAFATTSGGNGTPLVISFTSSTATPAAVQALLAQLAYSNTTSVDPTVNNTDPSRVFTVTLNDGGNTKDLTSTTTALTATLTGTINLTAINSSPVITPAGAAAYSENDPATLVDNTVMVSDVDDTQIAGGTISITGNFLAGDVLAVTDIGNITGSYNPATGVLTLSGTDTLANYQTVLRSLTYLNSTDDPTDNTTKITRSLTYSLTDANSDAVGAAIGTATKTINITPSQDAPVLTGGATLTYTEQAPAAVIDNTVTVASDADDTLMSSATVTLSAGFTAGDVLGFTNQLGITGSYNSLTGVLTLTGNATLADYTTALRSVTFNSTSDTPIINSANRTVTWQVNDANSDNTVITSSNTVTSTINILAINDAPIFTALGNTVSFTEAGSAVVLNNAVTISDVDLNPLNSGTGNYSGTTLTLARNGGANAEDVFSNTGTLAALTQGGNLTVGATVIGTVTTNSAGTLVLTFNTSATTALVNSALQQIAYRNNSSTPLATVQIAWLFNDQDPNITGGGIAGAGQDQGGGGLLTATGLTTVNIDRLPTANADTNSIAENTANVTANVITGATTADDQGDPAATVTGVALGTQVSTSGSVNTPVAGLYGSLTLNATGAYTYTLDNTNPTVNALLNGQTLVETYSYTITDADGDTSTTTLTITINGTTDNTLSIVPVDGNAAATGQTTVQESGLTSLVDTNETNTGTITLSALDGLASINVGSTPVTLAQLNNLGTTPITIVTPKGEITLTGYNSTSSVGGVSTGGTLSYSYTLTQVQNTPAATESTDNIALSITNAGGNTVTDTLIIQIIDDVTTANADTNSVDEGLTTAASTTTGNVFAAGSASDVADRIGADVPVNPVTAFSFGANNGTVGSPLNGAYGSLTLNANGSYTYSLDNTNPAVNALLIGDTLQETFNYTITDADGDTSTTTLTITINGITDSTPEITPIDDNGVEIGQATVFEKGLVAPSDKSQTTTGTIVVSTPDGMASVTIGGTTFTVAELAGFTVATPSVSIDTGEGILIVTGFNIAAGPGVAATAGTLSYSYTLKTAQTHIGEKLDNIALVVTDASSASNTATSTLNIRIVDDTPTANADANTVIEGTTTLPTTTSGNVFGKTGAAATDVADRIGADTTAKPVTAVSFGGNIKTVGTPFNSSYGSLLLNADGSYTYTLDNTNTTVNSLNTGQSLTETFSYTITDADGDTSTTNLVITISGRNDAPIAVNDSQIGVSGQPVIINVLSNDSDPENDINPATVKIVGTAKAGDSLVVEGQGTWSVNSTTGAITFMPIAGFTADPTPIRYTVKDKTGLKSNPATVTVDYPQNPPIAVNDNATANTGQAVTINVIDNDSDAENDLDPATVKIAGTANAGDSLVVDGQGTWSVNSTTGEITFKPMVGFTDDPTPIRYTVKDRTGLESNPATVRVDYPEVVNNSLTSGSLILLSNPDRAGQFTNYNELEKKDWHIDYKLNEDNSLPPIHLSLYIPIEHHVISLTGSVRDQVVLELERYSFSVPRWMFRHTDPNEQLEFEATRLDGSPLPEWLKFDPKTLRFSGFTPKCAHNEQVMVTARDTYGNEVHTTFNVHVNRERVHQGQRQTNEKKVSCEKAAVGKSGLSEQIHAVGKLSKLQESRALLHSLKQQ